MVQVLYMTNRIQSFTYMSNNEKFFQKTISHNLGDYITALLGPEQRGVRELPSYEDAVILHALVDKSLLFKVQFEDFDGSPLSTPKLWDYAFWHESKTNRARLKRIEEENRIKGWIKQANVKIISRVLMDEYEFTEDSASAYAHSLLNRSKFGKIRALGVKKLITKVEELK